MKVFISSLISGMEAERAAAKKAIALFRHQPVMAEDFGARPNSPQVACLSGLRDADAVVLILGSRYGAVQASGLSATHEEYREARGNKSILVFVQEGSPEPAQAALIEEVSGWEQGFFRASFADAEDLGEKVARALHDLELANAAGSVDPGALAQRAITRLPAAERSWSGASLQFALAAGPETSILRPAELESDALAEALQQQALFGRPPLFDRREGSDWRVVDHALVLVQELRQRSNAELRLWGTGDMSMSIPIAQSDSRGFQVVIEEDVAERLAACIAYAAWVLGHVDRTEKVSHVALAARVVSESAMGWRTRAEHAASPTSGSFDGFGQEHERVEPVQLSPATMVRAALTMNAATIAEDLLVLLRRRWKGGNSRVRFV